MQLQVNNSHDIRNIRMPLNEWKQYNNNLDVSNS